MNHQTDAIATKAVTGIATANLGLAAYLDVIQGMLAILATLLGLTLTSLLIYKEIRVMINQKREHKRRLEDKE